MDSKSTITEKLCELPDLIPKILDAARVIILANGGMTNGYETFIEGTLRANYIGSLKVKLPSHLDKRPSEIQVVEDQLDEALRPMVEGWQDIGEFRFYHLHVEYGCYKTLLDFKLTRQMDLL